MWAKFAAIILRNRLPFLIAIGLLTAGMGYLGQYVRMNYTMTQLLPSDDIHHIEYEEFQEQFGKDGSVMVIGVDDPKLYQLDAFNKWYDLTSSLKDIRVPKINNRGKVIDTIQGVPETLSITNAYTLVKDTAHKKFKLVPIIDHKPTSQEELDGYLKKLHNLPFYRNALYQDNSNATILAITLDRSSIDTKARHVLMGGIMDKAKKFEDETGIKLHYSGLPYIRANNTTKVAQEIKLFILLAILITALILFMFFRSLKVTFFSMLVVGIGVIWGLGVISLLGFKITILTGLIPPLIIVIGIPNCVFLLNKYHQEIKKHGNQIKALTRVIEKIGNAIFLTNTTTALGFATFIFTRSEALVEFGIVASLNIIIVFMLSILLVPIIFSYLNPPKEKHVKHLDNRFMEGAVEMLSKLVANHRKWVYGVTLVVIVASLYGMTRIRTTGNLIDDLPKDDPITLDLKNFFEAKFNGVLPLEVIVDTRKKGKALDLSTLRKIDELQTTLAGYKQISRPVSVVEGIKFARQAYYNGNPKRYALYNEQDRSFLASYMQNANDEKGLFNTFMDSTRQITRISAQIADIGTNEMDALMKDLKPKIDKLFPPDQYGVVLTGSSFVYLKGTSYLVKNLFTSLLIAVFLIAIIMAFLFSSIRMVLVSLLPNLLPLVFTGGLMGFFGIPIKPSTILVFSIAFGISVDDTIHYLAKYRQELKTQKWGIKQCVLMALRETGFSMIYTSIVLFFGFGIFTASKFGGTVALGILVSITLLMAMLSNLVLLPSLLLSLEKSLTTKAFRKEPMLELMDEEEDIDLEELEVKPEDEIALNQ